MPRTIVERMTPELPLASIVAARWTSAASCAVVDGGRAVELGDDSLHRLLEVRPRVAVGHGVDVERVDPAAVPFDVLERGRGEPPDGPEVDHSALRALSTWTSTALTSRPVWRRPRR